MAKRREKEGYPGKDRGSNWERGDLVILTPSLEKKEVFSGALAQAHLVYAEFHSHPNQKEMPVWWVKSPKSQVMVGWKKKSMNSSNDSGDIETWICQEYIRHLDRGLKPRGMLG